MDGLRQYLAIVAGESGNNIDEASAIGSVILNRLVHKGANMQGDFVSKIGGKGQYDAIGGKIYNEVMAFTDSDLLTQFVKHSRFWFKRQKLFGFYIHE